MERLKIAGAWSGVLEVELEQWTVPMLREEVARRSGSGSDLINLIWAGKVLKDGDGTQKLSELGVKNNAKVLASRVSADQGKSLQVEFMAEEERSSRLSRIKSSAISLAKRHADGSLPIEDFNIELEDQSGKRVHLGSETDQRAAMMGLMLHANAKRLIKRENFKDALEVLVMGEEAFSLCNAKVIEMIDNPPILQVDMVWCYFMLRDISWLSVAGIRLSKAREGIERAHGKESSRLRRLQGGRHPELALLLRLELLEGVVAYHSGQTEKSRKALTNAQSKYFQLQVPDEALSLLMSMGYKEREAKRALRMSNQDIQSAVDFLVEERAKKEEKRTDKLLRQKEIYEQKLYGVTPLRKAVDLERLKELVSIGFEKELAAEALRRNENDSGKALDDLTNPETNSTIQVEIESRKRKRLNQASSADIEQLVSMGFPRAAVVAAVRAFGSKDLALNHLTGQSNPNPASSSVAIPTNAGFAVEPGVGGSSDANEASGVQEFSGAPSSVVEDRDMEMEDELTEEIQNTDAFSDYDIEVAKEGEAINEYLALLDSTENSQRVLSSK